MVADQMDSEAVMVIVAGITVAVRKNKITAAVTIQEAVLDY